MFSSKIRRTGAHLGHFYRLFARFVAAVSGWRVEGEFPDVDKAIFVASPHTSNWDGFFMLMCAWHMRVRLSWITKHTMFRFPLRTFIRWAGGVPVDRRKNHNTVQQIADQFEAADELYLAIAPSGTRSKRDNWRSGFYHMAQAANVPLILGYVDYKHKKAGCGPVIHPTGDVKADMDRIRAFYRDIEGAHPHLHTRVQLRIEDKMAEEAAEAEEVEETEEAAKAAKAAANDTHQGERAAI
jgi:1-acyl-sn-glycerol-3-phosphate acyltransferase